VRWILGFASPKVATASRSEGIFILRLNFYLRLRVSTKQRWSV